MKIIKDYEYSKSYIGDVAHNQSICRYIFYFKNIPFFDGDLFIKNMVRWLAKSDVYSQWHLWEWENDTLIF